MTPELAVIIAQALIKYGPDVAAGLAKVLKIEQATLADWETHVFSKARKTYEDYVKGEKA